MVINRPTAKTERIVFAPFSLPTEPIIAHGLSRLRFTAPAPSCSPDEMPNLMPDMGWRRHFEEPIPLPDEMAAKAEQGYYHDFLSPLDLPELELDASPDAGASWPDFGNSSPAG